MERSFASSKIRSSIIHLVATLVVQILGLPVCSVHAVAETNTAPSAAVPASPPGTFNLESERDLNVLLKGPWRFAAGDTPQWSRPDFDDSHWSLLRTDESWTDEHHQPYRGVAWYRADVLVPTNAPALALSLPEIEGSYQVFSDGNLVATQGGLPPHPYPTLPLRRLVVLPSSPPSPDMRTLHLALRVWSNPLWTADRDSGVDTGFAGPIRIGKADLIQTRQELLVAFKAFDSVSMIFLALLETLAALSAIALFAFRRTEREYLWFGIALLLSATRREFLVYGRFHVVGAASLNSFLTLASTASLLAQIFFYARLLEDGRRRLYWIAIGATVAGALLNILQPWINNGPTEIMFAAFLLSLPLFVWIIHLVLRRAKQGRADARLLVAPILMQQCLLLVSSGLTIIFALGWTKDVPIWIRDPINWPFSMSAYDIPDALFLLAMLAILVFRFSRTRRHEETYEREREAARIVQQVLIPKTLPTVPGFNIASVYQPFGEVGGDFFQVLCVERGVHAHSLLVVIGDVSGKGLPAALSVSMLVGTFQTLASYTQSPAEILSAMNQRMSGRTNGGFTTCLVLRADPDGTLTMANAGHLRPYRNHEELSLLSDLPLGILPNHAYSEEIGHLDQGGSLTLITDGVIEARKRSGELFGFDRMQSISHQSAEAIAQAAGDFGQDDDLTVLKLTRLVPTASP